MTARPCIFGEVLFDHFPDGRRVLGGAPFNVAWHLQAFGAAPWMISRVGADDDGAAVQDAMSEWGMDKTGLATDPSLPTGQVRVRIEQNEPTYDIVHPAAWDKIKTPVRLPEFTLLYHGSLALRSAQSRSSCQELREAAAGKATIFVDVNLRSPWWSRAEVLDSLNGAHWVKLNGEELDLLTPGDGGHEHRAGALLNQLGLKGLLLTRGSRGALLLTADGGQWSTRPQAGIEVTDTVGAGDAMASVMILGILNGWDPQTSLDRAQSLASAIVARRGATVRDPAFYRRFIRDWPF
ncbi:MAG: carbohydrate kinase [Xanthomonadales bacterium]|nr:carbohydrate kinase [Gammaproteobacteria bacterium]NND55967.1 carbohydrate kinase [Xanthomonadales bacterium]